MTSAELPGEIRRFILSVIPSVPHLEALLLLHGRRDRWSVEELATRLYVGRDTVEALLRDLKSVALVDGDDGLHRYAPADAQMAATVDELASMYGRSVVAVARLIHSTSERKAQRFADAFRLRKEP